MKTLIVIGVVIATVAAILAMTDKTSLYANGQESQRKTITFTDIFINMSENGGITELYTTQQTINGTDDELRTAYKNLMKSYRYQHQNQSSTVFVNENNGTALIVPAGRDLTSPFITWFDGVLKGMNDQNQQRKNTHWQTTCTVKSCSSTHF